MPDIMGVWSSIRPTNNGGDTSADLTVDGYFEIRRCDPDTGKFTGFYWGPGIRNSPEEMKGSVIFESPTSYKIELSHPVGDQITRKYEGKLVAMDNNDDFGVQIVAGRYRDEVYDDVDERVNSDNGTVTRTSALMAGNGGQDNGTWVATKP